MQEQIKDISNRGDFLRFLTAHIRDFRENRDSWENVTIDEFLEGLASWVEDMDGYYTNLNIEMPQNIDWKIFADMLYAAKIYE